MTTTPVPLSVTELNNYVYMKDIQNPVNILQQPKAKLTTNVFINSNKNTPKDLSNDSPKDSPKDLSNDSPKDSPKDSPNDSVTVSNIKTTAFIPDIQKEKEIIQLTNDINNIIEENYNKNITSSIQNLSLSEINKNISTSCIGILDDALNKPTHITWGEYIQIILKKNQRYTYIGILLIFIAFYILLAS
jgi:hypothetical protein